MRDLAVLFLNLLTTAARLAGLGGARSVVPESLLVKQQLLSLNRSWKRSPHLRLSDRIIAGFCARLMRPRRLLRCAIVLKPSTPELRWVGAVSPRIARLNIRHNPTPSTTPRCTPKPTMRDYTSSEPDAATLASLTPDS